MHDPKVVDLATWLRTSQPGVQQRSDGVGYATS